MDRETVAPQVDEIPGPKAKERVEYHGSFAAPSTYVYEFVWDSTAPATGPFCTDADGNVLMDFTGHVAAAPLGYNNPDLLERMEEFDVVDPLKIAGQDFYTTAGDPGNIDYPGPAELMDRLTDVSPDYMDTVFLSNSGAEAVENALKICYDDTAGKYGITFEGAFHGRTLGTLSLNRSKEVYRRKFPELGSIHDVPFCRDNGCSPATCECGFFAGDTSQLRRMLHPKTGHVNADEVAYLIMEPIQGEGGYHVPSDAFLEEVADICEQHDILLIADEIQSGIGRTGEFWASDDFAIEPDVICAAKGARVGATIASEDVFPSEKSRLSSTWGAGDIIDSLQGALTIDVIREENLMDNAVERGQQAKDELADADLPNAIDVRGKGLMLAVEFDTKERRDDVQEAAMKRGLLTLVCGHKTLRLLPPLDVREREISMGVRLLSEAVEAAA
ncbi:aminotransferase class III-fold pyridoxal phosphate-dependent enzyme [Natronomonas halophila]|uniref:class-III pyridoxal-phosphate-dependent aminotransferase n=1 Tax=Natronomonas halophila TaxID=2747817 RepID=UPI0015B3A92B|nr:aminotransferase class III-fold pyridoxal phosphate-dependent enzyme [Natronomonas halophila]QLD84323.1 aminotransferase class III-fold pyridoxal phosphate-dependent enzyme [Natronomonas halophila]